MRANSTKSTNKIYRSQVLDRTFQMLGVLADDRSGLGVTELASKLDLHKSTTHRLIMVLESNRFVEKESATGKYRLGSRIVELGLSALSRLDIYAIARPHMRDLVDETGETAHLGVMRDGEIVSVVNVETTRTLRTPNEVGTRHPVHCSSLGKAILAFSSQQVVDGFLKGRNFASFTRNTITSPDVFVKELDVVRRNGFAVDDEEREEGLRCIGAPIWNNHGEVVGAVSIAGPAFRITRDRTDALAAAVRNTAGRVSEALGYLNGTAPVAHREGILSR
jgi:IclR family KDG regulon transcriptional repressor